LYANRIEFVGAKMVDRPPFPEDAEGFLEILEGMEEEIFAVIIIRQIWKYSRSWE